MGHAETVAVLAGVLRGDGHGVDTASDLAGAMTRCEMTDCRFDVLVCDAELADGGAGELLQEVRRRYPWTIGVMMTDDTSPGWREAAQAAGFFECVVKPVTAGELVGAVRRALLPV